MGAQREHPRFTHEAAITIHVAGREYFGRTRNLSLGGLCTDVTARLPVGTEVVVDIALVSDHGERSEAVHVKARIVWSTHVHGTRQTGLAFEQVETTEAEHLAAFLRHLDEAAHARNRARPSGVDEDFS